ncbi:MAG: hypothetical protein N4A65_00405 [Cohaesibacter sp.]|jgi:hypothetical protein|nr:hypothetical protein [Cohaesibacter sp.]
MTEWTKKTVGQEITKAYRTLNRIEGKVGPQGYGNFLAEHKGGKNSAPGDVDRMEAVFDILIKEIENIDERAQLMLFHSMKAKGRKIPEICEKLGLVRRTLYWKIGESHQKLIEAFALNGRLRGDQEFDFIAQKPQIPRVRSELRPRQKRGSIQGWMEPDARPDKESFGIIEAAE